MYIIKKIKQLFTPKLEPDVFLPLEPDVFLPVSKQEYFNKELRDQALEWLEEKWPKEKQICEICESKKWTMGNDLVKLYIFEGDSPIMSRISYPNILIICNNCGNTKCFNAVIAGIVVTNV